MNNVSDGMVRRFTEILLHNASDFSKNEACSDDHATWNYGDFFEHVFGIANDIQQIQDQKIGVLSEHYLENYAAIIAIWICGKTYVPIAITQDNNDIGHILNRPLQTSKSLDFQLQYSGSTYAYVLSTSGTTGKPKHIPISYENLSCFVDSFLSIEADIQPSDRLLQMADLQFDMSIISFLIPLCVGASFNVFAAKENRSLSALNLIETRKISMLIAAPSAVSLMLPYAQDVDRSSLRTTFFGAESLSVELAKTWQQFNPRSSIYNLYGPTEGGIFAAAHKFDSMQETKGDVPIGKPIKHVEHHLQPSDKEGEFELWISGPQVFNGYHDETSIFKNLNGKTWYPTGDIVRKNNGSDLVFIRRLDRQIKVQGRRINLDAMEIAIQNAGFYLAFDCAEEIDDEGHTQSVMRIISEVETPELLAGVRTLPDDLRPSKIQWNGGHKNSKTLSALCSENLSALFQNLDAVEKADFETYKVVTASASTWPNFVYDIEVSSKSIAEISRQIKRSNAPNALIVSADHIKNHEDLFASFSPLAHWPLMGLLSADNHSTPSDLDIVQVASTDQLGVWNQVASTGFGFLNTALFSIKNKSHAYYLGYKGEDLVSCGMLNETKDSIGIYHVTTLPEKRQQGYGSSMYAHLMSLALKKQKALVSQATEQSEAVWKKIGMETFGSLYLLQLKDEI